MFRIISFCILFILLSQFIVAKKYNAILKLHQTEIDVQKGKLERQIHYEIQINSREGEEHTAFYIPFSSINKVSKLEANIKDRNGNEVRKLKKGDILSRSLFNNVNFYNDQFVYEFSLKHNVYPYTVCVSYTETQKQFFYIDYWMPIIGNDIPTEEATLFISTSSDVEITYSEHNVAPCRVQKVNSNTNYLWQASYNGDLEAENYAPILSRYFPKVYAVPVNFKFDSPGSFESWESFGCWKYCLTKDKLELPDFEKAKIDLLLANAKNELEKIQVLYKYLQDNTRYISVSIETGGLTPYPASYVARNKYGDCKALSNYFIAMLKYAGITAYYTTIKAGGKVSPIDVSFPSQQFNHAIVCVPLQNDTLWLDCTSKFPFAYLGTFCQNRNAMVSKKEGSHLGKTPALALNDVLESRTVSFKRANNETFALFNKTLRGANYESMFHLDRSNNGYDVKQIMREQVLENGFELEDYSFEPTPENATYIQLNYTAKATNAYKSYGEDIVIDVLPFLLPKMETPEKRKLPLQISYPVYKTDSLNYQIPEGYRIRSLPNNENIESKFGVYTTQFSIDNNNIQLIKSYQLKAGDYPLEDYPDFYAFMEAVRKKENLKILTEKLN